MNIVFISAFHNVLIKTTLIYNIRRNVHFVLQTPLHFVDLAMKLPDFCVHFEL